MMRAIIAILFTAGIVSAQGSTDFNPRRLADVTYTGLGSLAAGTIANCTDCTCTAGTPSGSGSGAIVVKDASAARCIGAVSGTTSAKTEIFAFAAHATGAIQVSDMSSLPQPFTTSGGSNTIGLVEWPDGGGYLIVRWKIPTTWDQSAITFKILLVLGQNITSGNLGLIPGAACFAVGGNPTSLTYTDGSVVNTAIATAGTGEYKTYESTLTIPTASCSPGQYINIRIKRDTGDTFSSSAFGDRGELATTW